MAATVWPAGSSPGASSPSKRPPSAADRPATSRSSSFQRTQSTPWPGEGFKAAVFRPLATSSTVMDSPAPDRSIIAT